MPSYRVTLECQQVYEVEAHDANDAHWQAVHEANYAGLIVTALVDVEPIETGPGR